MRVEDDVVVKPIQPTSSQKILEKLELIDQTIDESFNRPEQYNKPLIKIAMFRRTREKYMSVN